MNVRKITAVYKKEIADTLRDRRTLLVMIIMPMLLYPALIAFSVQLQVAGRAKLEREISPIGIKGPVPRILDSLLRSDTLLKTIETGNLSRDLKKKKIAAYMETAGGAHRDSIKLFYDGAVDRSTLALERLRRITNRFRSMYNRDTLTALGVDTGILDRYVPAEINTAPPSRMGSYVLGMLIPMLLIMTIVMGAMYPAIDLTAGEKERGTMETILSVPVDKNDLFIGKYLTVCTIAMITACVNLLSMILTFSAGIIQLGAMSESLEFTLTPQAVGIVLLLMVPLAMFASAVLLTGAVFARSFKDAQNLMTPILLVLMVPAMTSAAPGIELNAAIALVPILNLSLLFKEILLNNFNLNLLFLVFLSNTVFALAAVITAASTFGREETLLGDGKGMSLSFHRSRITPSQLPSPAAAILIFSVVMILVFYVGATLQSFSVYPGLAVTEWALILFPPLFFAWYMRLDLRATFNIRAFKPVSLLGTLLLCFGTLGLGVWAGMVQARYFPESIEIAQALKKILDIKEANVSPWVMFLLIAASPAICEELLFRGMILSSLKQRLRSWQTVMIVALLFAIAHMNLFRFLPTFILGLSLSFIVVRTGSIFLSMIAHGVNNGFVLSLVCFPALAAHFSWLGGKGLFLPAWATAGSIALAIAGATLILSDTSQENKA